MWEESPTPATPTPKISTGLEKLGLNETSGIGQKNEMKREMGRKQGMNKAILSQD